MKRLTKKKLYYFIIMLIMISQSIAQSTDQLEISPPNAGESPMIMKLGKGGPPAGPFMPFMLQESPFLKAALEDIGVNAQNIDKILSISRSYKKTFDEKIIRLQREELNIKEELLKDNSDLQSLQSMINKKTQVFGEIEFQQIKRDLEIKAVLSDEEYDKLKSAIMEHMHQMMPKFHNDYKDDKFDKKRQ